MNELKLRRVSLIMAAFFFLLFLVFVPGKSEAVTFVWDKPEETETLLLPVVLKFTRTDTQEEFAEDIKDYVASGIPMVKAIDETEVNYFEVPDTKFAPNVDYKVLLFRYRDEFTVSDPSNEVTFKKSVLPNAIFSLPSLPEVDTVRKVEEITVEVQ